MNSEAIDVGYTELNSDGNEKTPLYLRIGEVARELNLPTSKVRYWSDMYYELLDGEKCNTHRRFSKEDVSKLRLIKNLSENNYSHEHILHELKNFEFDDGEFAMSTDSEGSNKLQVQMLASAIMEEQKKEFVKLKEELFDRVDLKIAEMMDRQLTHQDNLKEELIDEVSVTIDEVMGGKFESLENGVTDLKREMKEEFKIAYATKEALEKKKESRLTTIFKKIFE